MKNLNDIVSSNLCLGCGICTLNLHPEEKLINLQYSKLRGRFIPTKISEKNANSKVGFEVCPAKGYKINSLALKYQHSTNFHLDLGYYDKLQVTTSIDGEFTEKASSSGVTTHLLHFLLNEKLVDKVIVTKYLYTEKGPIAKAFITDKKEDLKEAQGSKYCPVDLSDALNELIHSEVNVRFAFVGTPCQIAGVRKIQTDIKHLGIQYFIGNFCGGFKSYNNLRRLITMNGAKLKDISYFRFRGGGQPGSMKIIDKSMQEYKIPYPEYVMMTGYSKLKRCHLCVDATAELADFSCGDAWLDKFQNNNTPTSIVITRNKESSSILKRMEQCGLITLHDIEEVDVIKSQKGNIASKKHRQFGRLKLYRILSIKVPELIEGFYQDSYSLVTEIHVLTSHRIKFIFEKLHLFKAFYYRKSLLRKIMFRLFKDNYN